MRYFNKNDIKNIKSYNFDFIELFELNHILTVTLNRPKKKNALHPQMINEIAFAFQYASNNDNIRALKLKSKGNVFCSGLDLKALAGDVEKNNSTVPIANSKILIDESSSIEVVALLICLARILAHDVLPTPLGPQKRSACAS